MVTSPARCYIHWPGEGSQTIPVNLSGFAPLQALRVELRIRGKTVSGLPSLTADAAGGLATELANWTSGLGDAPTRGVTARIVVSDLTLGTELASTEVDVANAGLDIDSADKDAGAQRRWIVSGLSRLSGGQNYYAFYFSGKKLIGRQKLGAAGKCGYLRTRARLIPFTRVGKYQLRVQASPVFRKSRPWVGGTVKQTRKRR